MPHPSLASGNVLDRRFLNLFEWHGRRRACCRDRRPCDLRAVPSGRHRPARARRTVNSVAAFFVPHLRPGDRLVDLGCGPASVTVGLGAAVRPGGTVVGVDLDPGPAPVPLARGDIHRLPFPDRSFDAIFMCAVLQHVADPLRPLLEARQIARSGTVIGVADADWGGAVIAPDGPRLQRGQEIITQLRVGSSPYVGRELRGLLTTVGVRRRARDGTGSRWRRS
jgi:SAM-dependent methyltransferase